MSSTTPALRRYLRSVLTVIGKLVLRLLTRTRVYGVQRIPERGPFIIAGNHRAVMEILLMVAVTRPQVDIVGAGDFPLDPSFRFLARAYGYIPYRRGSVDGQALRRAQRVLEAGGVVGIFPEGGIWTDGPKDTQRGVAWLAARSGAAVVPMGFAGIDDGVARTFALQFPRFEIHVGTPLTLETEQVTRSTLDEFSASVMAQVESLLPEWDRPKRLRPEREEYFLELEWAGPGTPAHGYREFRDGPRAAVISRFYYLPVLLSIFEVNLRRDVSALRAWKRAQQAQAIEQAINRIIGYLALRNRYLFTYRLGTEQGTVLEQGLRELRDWLRTLSDTTEVRIIPVRRLLWADGWSEEERAPESPRN
jgi:1-acyl-sn-glycerol-3-phosphate acyltransferase